MRTVRNIFSVPAWLKGIQLGALALIALGADTVLAQPTNDNFANAIIINGLVGQTTGSNSNATMEVGEPGVPPNLISTPTGYTFIGASVWYEWIAPTSGNITFDTVGSSFDTVLVVYTGAAVNSLTQVAADDNGGGANFTTFTSKVIFTAVQGTTYYISVGGFGGFFSQPPAQGDVVLNWNGVGTAWAGQFRLTNTKYTYSDRESFAPTSANMTSIGARATVTRVKGYAGKVNVGYILTSGIYTNIYATNFFGTIDTNNVMTSNSAVRLSYQNYDNGFYYSTIDLPGSTTTYTNTQFVSLSNNIVFTNATFCTASNNWPPNYTLNNPPAAPIDFCYTVYGTNYLPAANVSQTNTLVFNDWQMNQDITINASSPAFAGVNGLVLVTLDTNTTALDPGEDQTLPSPLVDAANQTAYVTFLNTGGVVPRTVGLLPTTNTVFNFERATIRCTEFVGTARVAVYRTGTNFSQGATLHYVCDEVPPTYPSGTYNAFPLQAGSDYATPDNANKYSANVDYTTVTGTLTWGVNDGQPKFINIPINDDNLVEFNEDFYLQFDQTTANAPQGGVYGNVSACTVTILFDNRLANSPDAAGNWIGGEQPAGALDRSHNPDLWPTTSPGYNLNPGANGTVYAVAVQPGDTNTIIAGDFTGYNGTPITRIARMKFNGMLDPTFNPGSGADAFIYAVSLDASGKIIAGGGFTSMNGNYRSGVARLNANGSLDTTFDPGFGTDQPVLSTAVQPDGQILIAGEFSDYNFTNRNAVARLNPDGSLDTTFDPGVGPNGVVYSVAVQPDGKILIGGDFTSVDGVPFGNLARLNPDGTLDTTFNNTGFGADDIIYSVVVQPDGRILVGGAFNHFNLLGGKGIARVNSDGSVDTSFDVGVGTDDVVYSLALQNDGVILVGGVFKSVNLSRRISFARLYSSGAVDTTFMDTAYNQFAGLVNAYHDPNVNPPNPVYGIGVQGDGNIIIGGTFAQVGGGFTRDDIHPRSNVARLIGGSTPGSGNIQLNSSYTADSGSPQYYISLTRTNGTLGSVSAAIQAVPLTPGPGAAIPGVDYSFNPQTPTWGVSWGLTPPSTWMLSDGYSGPNNQEFSISGVPLYGATSVYINILSNNNANATLNLALTQPIGTETFFLGGENIPLGAALGTSISPLTIVHNNNNPGVLSFSSATYITNENAGSAIIAVSRTGGSSGTVTVKYSTTTNGTALANADFSSVNGKLTFIPGQTNQTFTVPIIDNTIVQSDRTIGLTLFTTSGGATLGLTNAQVVIVDNDLTSGHVGFGAGSYGANETDGNAVVTVNRLGGSLGSLGVTVASSNGTAVNGINYIGFTNTLTWASGDVSARTLVIPVLDDGVVTSNLTANLRLFNGVVNGTNNNTIISGIFTNASLIVTNVDATGKLQFTSASYSFNENGGQAIIPVVRTGGSAGSVTVNFSTHDATAFAGTDYVATNGFFTFGPGEVAKTFRVTMINDFVQNPPRFIGLTLNGVTPTNGLGSPSTAVLNIVDDESVNVPPGQPDTTYSPLAGFNDNVYSLALQSNGQLLAGGDFTLADGVPRRRIARLNPDGTLDSRFSTYLASSGASGTVRSIVVQTNGAILVGGFFTNFNNVVMNRIARLNYDGSLDSSFNPGFGANGAVYTMAETFVNGQRRILVGGGFAGFGSVNQNYLVGLLNGGAVDPSFNTGSGPNGTVYAVAVQNDGRIVIGGDFTAVNGVALNHVARLNPGGSVDPSFNPGSGASDSVRAVAIQLDGRILIGGLFTSCNGTPRSHIARLLPNGSVDNTFTPGAGADNNVETIAVQNDTRIIVGGDFTSWSGVTRNRITRLNPDGTPDLTINFGLGANSFVSSAVIELDGNVALGGGFTKYNNLPYAHIVRIYGGSVAGSGVFQFTSATFPVDETSSNIVITVLRTGGTSGGNADGSGNINVTFKTSDATAVAGINYDSVVTNLVFPAGEVVESVAIPIHDDGVITSDLTANLILSNPSPAGSIGNSATLIIINDDNAVTLSSPTYQVAKNSTFGVANIGILRLGGTNNTSSVIFMTTTNGTAVPVTDYLVVSNLVTFAPGVVSNNVTIPIVNNGLAEGNRTVTMMITNASSVLTNAAATLLLPPTQATLTIIDNVQAPGKVMFTATNLVVTEGNSNVVVTVVRTNGTSGTITVDYATIAGSAAPGVNYTTAVGTLTFGNGETVKTFNVPLLDNNLVQGPVTLTLALSNPTGGAGIQGSATLPMTILDNDTGVAFASAAYVVSETNGSVALNVLRLNNTAGVVQVSYATTNGSAMANTNFLTTSGTLTFNPGETNKTINIPILHDLRATSNLTFGVNLANPTGGAQLTFPSTATVIVLDAEAGVAFTNSNFTVLKNATNVVLAVFCSNPNVEPLSVNYASADGTAVAGIDYASVSGVLTFTNGAVTNYIIVPIINNSLIEGDLNFTVALSSPTAPGQLLSPSTATVTIIDVNAGMSFSSPTYTVLKNGVSATIGVVRSGYTNSTASVDYTTLDGTGTNGVDYTAVSGTLVFTNGQTSLSFAVPVTDSTTVKPDRTVLLQLSNPVGTNGVLASPSAALLTIRDNSGSLIVPAGVALLSESGPVNGVIDPGESVSLLFALRNGGGTNTANLTATLLATNGVTSPSAAQNYGALLVNGPSASRPYSFIANGSNGQPVVATFLLTNGTVSAGSVTFTFTLGNSAMSFTNAGTIIIPAQGAASPYASTINVSGVGGSLTKATVNFNKMWHGSASDIDALLVSPTGQKMLLMANAGGFNALNGVSLTFDDAAATYLPQSGQIVTGTNKPSPYFPVTVFPAPAPAAPYNTNLATFNGNNPNGTWSLYVLDDSPLNSGMISNGWSLNLTAVNQVGSTADLLVSQSANSSVIAGNNLTYTVTVTNYGPSTATGVILGDTLPGTASLVSNNASQGGVSVSSGQVTWSVGTLPINTGAALTLVVTPSTVGTITNNCSVQGNEYDPNTVNNSASAITVVDAIKADLVLSMVDAPDPLWGGNNVTYTLTVNNAGPATAPGVVITNTLPPSVVFLSASPASYVLTGNVLAFTNLGNILVGGQTVATIVVKTTSGGTITNSAITASQVTDPFKANNSASVKTLVNSLVLGVVKSGANLVISWPTNTPGYYLESTANLGPSAVWTQVTTPAPVVNGGQYVITISIGSGTKFYRLHGP